MNRYIVKANVTVYGSEGEEKSFYVSGEKEAGNGWEAVQEFVKEIKKEYGEHADIDDYSFMEAE